MVDAPQPTLNRVLLFLMIAVFAVALNIRITDPLLPSLAAEFNSSTGKVAIVSVLFALAHGTMLFAGASLGDLYGKLRIIVIAAFVAAVTTAICAFATSISTLALLRLMSAASAAAIFPLAMAFLGDATPYNERQVVLARLLGAAMLGVMSGQAVSGLVADRLGWRAVFLIVGVMFAVAAFGLALEYGLKKSTIPDRKAGAIAALVAPFLLLNVRNVQLIVGMAAAEGFFVYGATTFIGAYLSDRFGLSTAQIGLVLAMFGAGGLAFTIGAFWIITRLGQRHLVTTGGMTFSVMLATIALTPIWQWIPLLLFVCGMMIMMLHNTLQLYASQMATDNRGAALSLFSGTFFIAQVFGVAVSGITYDYWGGTILLLAASILFTATTLIMRTKLQRLEHHNT